MPDAVSFSGSTVTVTLERPLKAGETYHVTIDPTAITDMAGNAYAGIADDATLTFTVAGA